MRYLHYLRHPLLVFIVGASLSFSQYLSLKRDEHAHIRSSLEFESYKITQKIKQQLQSQLFLLQWQAQQWQLIEQKHAERWRQQVSALLQQFSYFRTIKWLDPELNLVWSEPTLSSSALDHSVDIANWLTSEQKSHFVLLEEPLVFAIDELKRGAEIALLLPVGKGDNYQGAILAEIQINKLLDNIVRTQISDGYQLSISDNTQDFYTFYGDKSLQQHWYASNELDAFSQPWRIDVWPTRDKLSELSSGLAQSVAISGTLGSLLLAILLMLWRRSRRDSIAISKSNRHLQSEVQERRRVEKQLERLVNTNSLTTLPNLRGFEQSFSQIMAQRTGNAAILVIDLDHFKEVNDALGHNIGDGLIIKVARRLKKLLQDSAILAHMGADEFAIGIINYEDIQEVRNLAKMVITALDNHFFVDDYELFISASVGIAVDPDGTDDVTTLLRSADSALNLAKARGRNTFCEFTQALHKEISHRLEMGKRLRQAVANEEFDVFYQPKIDLKSNRIIGFEALVRWLDKEKGFISPDEFIPIAEDTGLILPLGELILKQACAQLSRWHQIGFGELTMAINISGKQLQSANLLNQILDLIRQYKLPAHTLELELTEQVFIDNIQSHTQFMHQARQHGLALAIDDFGVGYSSLAYLKNFPVNQLKIDRSFVKGLPHDSGDASITSAIISMANNLGLKVVAEGVENDAQLKYLKAQHCDVAQGYFFSKPESGEVITKLLLQYEGTIPHTLSKHLEDGDKTPPE